MNLSKEDAALYYKLRMSTLAYTNQKLAIVPQVATPADMRKLSLTEIAKLSAAFYDDAEMLGRYLAENPDFFSPGDLGIVASWKRRISGDFYVMRYLKAYSIFMSSNPAHLYGVLGLKDPIGSLLGGAPLPLLVRAVLLPFRDRIICDGLISIYSVTFGGGMRARLNRAYSRLKENEGIIEGLVNVEGEEQARTSIHRRIPARPAPDWRPAIGAILAEVEKIRQTDTKLQAATIGLLRAAAGLAHSAFHETDAIGTKMRSVRRAMTHLENQLHEQGD